MFTGIVKGLGTVVSLEDKPGLRTFSVEFPGEYFAGLQIGASVAIDGVCLTVTKIFPPARGGAEGGIAVFDAMQETLDKTTIGRIAKGSRVNVERSYRVGDEVGGHIVSGHVTTMAEIIAIDAPENNRVITFKIPPALLRYLFPKGFVALDGCSLTIADVNKAAGTFSVWLIPETLSRTTFGLKRPGDLVNLEIDSKTQAIVDTVENYLQGQGLSSKNQTLAS